MIKKSNILYIIIGSGMILMNACNFGVASAPKGIDYNAINTAAVQTVQVLDTMSAAQTLAVKLNITLTGPKNDVTNTALPTLSPTPVPPSATPVPPSATPVPPTPVPPTPLPCNWVKFIDDISVPDNTAFYPNAAFTKTWRLQNIGTCSWTSDYEIAFAAGEAMGGPVSQKLGRNVNPGEMIDLTIRLTAPSALGSHTGDWLLRNPSGAWFGLGPTQSKPFWVTVNVVTSPTIGTNTPLDFAANYCAAVWTNSGGTTLPCPAQYESFSNGSIQRNDAPKIEKDYQDNEPALITIPNNGTGGFISGRFPDVIVKSGDHFRALTGCLASSPNCSVGFAVKYSADGGSVQTLSTWTEIYDGKWTRPDIDLSFLAGKHVQFILEVNNSNNSSVDDRAFWMVPMIGP